MPAYTVSCGSRPGQLLKTHPLSTRHTALRHTQWIGSHDMHTTGSLKRPIPAGSSDTFPHSTCPTTTTKNPLLRTEEAEGESLCI